MAYLQSYTNTYLKEEIWNEHVVRKLEPFQRFLEVAAQTNGEILNFTRIGSEAGVDVKTAQSYYQILEDTLVGLFLPAHHYSVRKQQRLSPKFYWFDTGVVRALQRLGHQDLADTGYTFGKVFEHFVILEAHRLNAYLKNDFRFSYLRTKEQLEIDLIVERPGQSTVLIEIKSTKNVNERDVSTLGRFLKDFPNAEAWCLSQDPLPKKWGEVLALPWQDGLKKLFSSTNS